MLRWWHGIVLQPQVPYVYLSIFFLNTFSDCAAHEFRCGCRLGRGASGDEARRGIVVAPVVAPVPEELDMEIEAAVSRFKAKPLALTTETGCDTSTGMIIHSTPPAPHNASPEY